MEMCRKNTIWIITESIPLLRDHQDQQKFTELRWVLVKDFQITRTQLISSSKRAEAE